MKNNEIRKTIEKQVSIITNGSIKIKHIDWDMDLARDVGLDSVLFIKLLTRLEKHYTIEVDLSEIEINKITNITYLTEYLDNKLNNH
jgi:acyl carrier protein